MFGTLALNRRGTDDGGEHYQTSLTSVRQARAALGTLPLDEALKERAALVLSELTTNAVLHAGVPFVVTVRFDDHSLRLEVEDASPQMPVMAGESTMSGRGLRIVEALSDSWGTEPKGAGKMVWAELR